MAAVPAGRPGEPAVTRLVALVAMALGLGAAKLVLQWIELDAAYALLVAVLAAIPLMPLEMLAMHHLSPDWRERARLDGLPFPYVTLGFSAGIVLVGRGVI